MGCVQRAVLQFDEEVQAPWRPLLVQEPIVARPVALPARRSPARPSSSRVGACRPAPSAYRRPPADGPVPCLPSDGQARTAPPARSRSAGPVGGQPPARQARSRVRLTRRARRLAVALAWCVTVLAGSWLGQLVSDGAERELRLVGVSSVVVEPGDTLWSIATEVAGDHDIRLVVDRIQEMNGLEGAALVPGQRLSLP